MPQTQQKSGLILVAGGCAVLLVLLTCTVGVGAGIWWWATPGPGKAPEPIAQNDKGKNLAPPNPKEVDKQDAKGKNPPPPNPKDGDKQDVKEKKPVVPMPKEIVDTIKAKNPIKGTAPLGKVADGELDPPFAVWDFEIRTPKGIVIAEKNKESPGSPRSWTYRWQGGGPEFYHAVSVMKMEFNLPLDPFTAITVNRRKFKSDPGEEPVFDTIHLPQPIEINGLNGARMWMLTEVPPHIAGGKQIPKTYSINLFYRYHDGAYAYVVNAWANGATEAAVRQKANLLDASICTFRKR